MLSCHFFCPLPPPIHGASILAEDLMNFLDAKGTPTNFYSAHGGAFSVIRRMLNVLRSITRTDYRIAVVFTASAFPGKLRDSFLVMLLLLAKKKVVIVSHNNPFFSRSMLGAINLRLAKFCTTIFSYPSQEFLLLKANNYDARVIYTAAPNEPDLIALRKDMHWSKNVSIPRRKLRVLICSHVLPFKNVDKALEALASIELPYEVDVIGSCDTEYGVSVKNRLESAKVRFHGALFGKKKLKQIGRADLLLHFSENEELPLIQLECMAVGLPFLSFSGVGGLASTLPDNLRGFYFHSPEDLCSPALEKLLKRVLNNRELSARATDYYNETYSGDRMRIQFSEVIKELDFECS